MTVERLLKELGEKSILSTKETNLLFIGRMASNAPLKQFVSLLEKQLERFCSAGIHWENARGCANFVSYRFRPNAFYKSSENSGASGKAI